MYWPRQSFEKKNCQLVEMPGIEPGAFHMQSERSTTEPHPHVYGDGNSMKFSVKLFTFSYYFNSYFF